MVVVVVVVPPRVVVVVVVLLVLLVLVVVAAVVVVVVVVDGEGDGVGGSREGMSGYFSAPSTPPRLPPGSRMEGSSGAWPGLCV